MQIQNEKGAALLYVLMVSMLLVLIVPSVLYLGSNSDLQNIRSEKEKIVNQLAVSGMQAIARYPGTLANKLSVLQENYGESSFTLPDGLAVVYRQYAVEVAYDNNWDNRVLVDSLETDGNYKIVTHAFIGTIEKMIVSNFDLASNSISISTYPIIHQTGYFQLIAVTINTNGYDNETPVSVEFVTDAGTSLAPAIINNGTITNNTSSVSLFVDGTVVVGTYRIKVTVSTNIDMSTIYTISDSTPPDGQQSEAIVFLDGVKQTFTQEELEATNEIITDGILFIPSSYDPIQYGNDEVNYIADKGIYIGADIKTQGGQGNLIMSACNGAIVIDGAEFYNNTSSTDIIMQAGTYISAKETTFEARDIYLIANSELRLQDSNHTHGGSGNINLSAFSIESILKSGATFSKTPNETDNGGDDVQCY